MIQGHGSSNPDVILVADAAYGEDLTTGYALTGYQESILREMCHSNGLNLSNFYRTCLIKDAAPKTEDEKVIEGVVKHFSPFLIDEIKALKPFLVIPLGELSFAHLSGLHSIRKFRGSVVYAEGSFAFERPQKVMGILGPYPYLNQEYRLKYISRIDFGKISKHLNYDPTPDKASRVWIAWTSSQLRAFLERAYNPDGLLVFDIETYMGTPTCISFCFDGNESVCVPFMDPQVDNDNRVLMMELIARLLDSPIGKANQNVKYDWKVLERWGYRVNNVVGDSMLAASTLYCEFPKNLGFLSSIYTDLPYFKDEGREFDPEKHRREQFYLYNAKDSLATHQIITKQVIETVEQGVDYVYGKLIEAMPVYRRMEDRGIAINMAVRQELLDKYTTLYEMYCKKLSLLTEQQYINPLSSVQMNKLVFDELAFTKIRGVKGTDADSLELLMALGESRRSPQFGKEILRTISDCRKIHKVIEVLELPLHPDNRFRCEFNLAGTETGRSTGGITTDRIIVFEDKKLRIKNLGHSLQTIGKHGFMLDGQIYGKDLRRMFVPSPGYRFVEVDLNGAEARVDRVLSGNFDMTPFDNPGIHKLTGSWVYGCKPSEINKTDIVMTDLGIPVNRYYVAKQVRHAGERNITAKGLVTKLLQGFSIREGQKLLDIFHQNQPEIKGVFHRDITTAINASRELRAPNGRLRQFFDRIEHDTINQGISQLPQAVVSDQTKFEGILPTARACPWAEFLTEQHDGILAEVPESRTAEFIEVYRANVEREIDFRRGSLKREFSLSIPSEASIGDNWYEMEEVK